MPRQTIYPAVQFHFLKGSNSLSQRHHLRSFIVSLFKKEGKRLDEIHYIFCSDDYLLGINRQYLKHDYYTDIITFGLSEPGQPINAEIYISIDRVKENAREFKTSIKRELHRVIFHGALHLCGYKDKKKEDQQVMRKMEDKYLVQYFR
ncbi:MAG: rRNA maturation RNase YbeY [Chitinophagaceae bacterium]|nr:rRNA maturation RNase YbeY [Chitinophagaceae bacterium]